MLSRPPILLRPGTFTHIIRYIASMNWNSPRFVGGAIVRILAYYIWPGLAIAIATNAGLSPTSQQNPPSKPRLLILTDIGGDPDDQQSLIRLSLYFNEFEMEGFIASASGTPGELGKAVVKPHLIEEIIQAYGEVRPHLLLHDPHYPESGELIEKIKRGNPHRGLSFIGQGHDTEGSDWIIKVVDKPSEVPLNIAIWGGQTDLFQALWKVKNSRSPAAYREFVRRIRIYDIADQDGIFDEVIQDYPGLFYILNKAPEGEDKRNAVFRGMYLGGDESWTSLDWIQTNVQQNHGPLGALYPLKTWTAPNPHGVMKEGDTPSWFYFLPNGLGDLNHPEWGGWGGRFKSGPTHYVDAQDTVRGTTHARATVWRWRPQYQRDFQARMDWCVMNFDEANHHPVIIINHHPGQRYIEIWASPGEKIYLSASGSSDPDGDSLSYRWFVYPEPGTPGTVPTIMDDDEKMAECHLPEESNRGDAFHIILEVTDDGEPSLTSYRRIVVRVK